MDNPRIIHAPINTGRRYGITSPITQYDYGYLLLPEGVELPTTYEIDFSNDEKHGTSFTVYGNSEGAEVPEELIRTGKDVFAFYYKVGDGYGKTDYTWRIPNHCRPDRDGGTPTPSQQSSIDQLIVRSNEAVEQAEQSASDASTSAQNASADAERAEEARTDAQNYATQAEQARDDAQTYANNASASASASAQSASQSAQIKSDIEGMVDDAQASASASAQSATASANSASQAQGYAQSASASAQSASGYASNAQTSANTASTKAQDASTSAQTASAKATEASQSATTASNKATEASGYATASQTAQGLAESARDSAISAKNDAEQAKADAESARDEAQSIVDGISGALDNKAPVITDTASEAIASFSDGADNLPLKSLVVDINPVQDLHGQDAPYPAGGGKNLFDIEKWFSDNNVDYTKTGNSYSLTLKTALYSSPFYFSDEDVTVSISAKSITDGTSVNARIYLVDKNGNAVQNSTINSGTLKRENLVAAGVRFDWNSGGTITIEAPQIELGSTATAYAPYENLCPISGWTEVDVEQRGVNIFDKTQIVDGYINDANGELLQSLNHNKASDYIPVVPNATYYIKSEQTKGAWGAWYDKDKNFVSGIFGYIANTSEVNKIKTAPSNARYMRLTVEREDGTSYVGNVDTFSVNYPSTDHSYHPYTGRSISIPLGQTVYGGKLDVLTGKLVIDRAIATLDNANLLYQDGDKISYRLDFADRKLFSDSTTGLICSAFIASTDASPAIRWRGAAQFRLSFLGTSIETLTSLINNGQLVVSYLIATPITIQLTPNQVNSLLGVNNIWADSGDTEVEYRADTKLFIERLTAPDSVDMIADANITSGQYFMVGNNLFKATANIANGAQIIVGTNCIRKSLSEALNEINA